MLWGDLVKLARTIDSPVDDGHSVGIQEARARTHPSQIKVDSISKDNYRIPGQYPTVMDVRVIIMSHPDGSAQVSVSASKTTLSWIKKYRYKQICLNELISIGLLTHSEGAEEHASNLANKNLMFVVDTQIEPEVLRVAGFVEQKKVIVN